MTNILYYIGIGLFAIFLIFVVLPLFITQLSNWYYQDSTQRTLGNMPEQISKLCDVDQTIRTNLNQTLIDALPGETWKQLQTKEILRKILLGEPIIESEYQIILDVLTIAQKKKLNIGDLEIGCNLIQTP